MAVKELLTVKEFAELSGKSKQAIYKQLNNRLKDFVQIVNNQNMIQSKALKDVYGIDPEKIPDPNIQSGLENTLYEIFRAELEAKNEQILALQAELAEERKHSREQADKIAVFADQAQKLQLAQMKPQITEDSEEDGKMEQEEVMPEKRNLLETISQWLKKRQNNENT